MYILFGFFFFFIEGSDKNLLTSLGSGTDSEEDEDVDKPMFNEGDDDDFYEQLVISWEFLMNNSNSCVFMYF